MMRAFYITAVVLTLVFIIVSLVYMERVHSARMASYYNTYDSYDSYGGSSYNYSLYDYDNDITQEMGFISVFFFLVYLTVEILTFVKIKTRTMKVLTIIGISFTGIMLLWDALMISSPGGISFDEVGPAWILFGIIQLAFCIVGMVHAFKKKV
jgi:hypothetical protein